MNLTPQAVAEHLRHHGFHVTATVLDAAIAAYQSWHGLEVTGEIDGPTARTILTPRFCGHPDVMAVSEDLAAWPSPEIRYYVTNPAGFPGLSRDQVRAAFAWAWDRWAAVCGIAPEEVGDPAKAHVVIECARIDRAGQVLAWSELADGTARQKAQRYDSSEAWASVPDATVPRQKIDLNRVACHEIGHVLGLPHIASGNLLQPLYDPSIWAPRAGDVREAQARYGPPLRPAAPPPEPPSGGWTVTLEGTGDLRNVVVPGFRVTRIA